MAGTAGAADTAGADRRRRTPRRRTGRTTTRGRSRPIDPGRSHPGRRPGQCGGDRRHRPVPAGQGPGDEVGDPLGQPTRRVQCCFGRGQPGETARASSTIRNAESVMSDAPGARTIRWPGARPRRSPPRRRRRHAAMSSQLPSRVQPTVSGELAGRPGGDHTISRGQSAPQNRSTAAIAAPISAATRFSRHRRGPHPGRSGERFGHRPIVNDGDAEPPGPPALRPWRRRGRPGRRQLDESAERPLQAAANCTDQQDYEQKPHGGRLSTGERPSQ